jgi:hypothetical protein
MAKFSGNKVNVNSIDLEAKRLFSQPKSRESMIRNACRCRGIKIQQQLILNKILNSDSSNDSIWENLRRTPIFYC